MKLKTLTIIISSMVLFSCTVSKKEVNDTQVIQKFYKELNAGDFAELSKYIGDSIVVSEQNDHSYYSKKEYYQWFQWDSVFSPEYRILDIKQQDKQVEVTISKIDSRIQFLNQKPLVSTEHIQIKNHNITEIHFINHDSDFKLWGQTKEKIITWIKNNHPELDGFMYDQTKKGAQHYQKAITLYQEAHN